MNRHRTERERRKNYSSPAHSPDFLLFLSIPLVHCLPVPLLPLLPIFSFPYRNPQKTTQQRKKQGAREKRSRNAAPTRKPKKRRGEGGSRVYFLRSEVFGLTHSSSPTNSCSCTVAVHPAFLLFATERQSYWVVTRELFLVFFPSGTSLLFSPSLLSYSD